jgi:putative phage-type endonuclease
MAQPLGLTPEQLAQRKLGVGASDVPAILGLDPYRSALDVFLDKTGQAVPFPENRFTRWGHRLEGVIADEYADRHPVVRLEQGGTIVGDEPWMLATPDRLVWTPAVDWGLECKSRGTYARDDWGEDGSDEVPHAVAAQCHWGMIVTHHARWDVAVLIGGNDYREYTLLADADIHASLIAAVRKFWFEFVQANVHPPFIGAEGEARFLLRTYPTHTGEIVPATPELNDVARKLQIVRGQLGNLDTEKARLEAVVKEFIGGRLGVEGPFGRITWKHMDPVEVKAHTKAAHRRLLTKFNDAD